MMLFSHCLEQLLLEHLSLSPIKLKIICTLSLALVNRRQDRIGC
jgi:hypothetical protein